MNGKYTVRDFLVYFLTGVFLLIMVLFASRENLEVLLQQPTGGSFTLKDTSQLLIVFFLIPTLYIAGHLIQGMDEFIIFRPSKMLWQFHEFVKNSGSQKLPAKALMVILNFLVEVFWSWRITGQLDLNDHPREAFWMKFARLNSEGKHERAEYWSMMHTLSEGLTFISLAFFVYAVFYLGTTDIVVGAVLTFFFRMRCTKMAENFIATVRRMSEIISVPAVAATGIRDKVVTESGEEVLEGE